MPQHLGKHDCAKSDVFSEKFQRGGGGIFNPKIYVTDFGNFKQDFSSMEKVVISEFRVCFVLRKITTTHTLKKALVVIPA